jgi:choline dehydrogenase-like flavoprotein
MATPTPETLFTRDILGNYLCNTVAEAKGSGPFDAIIVGGGTFGLALAQDLFDRGRTIGSAAIKPANYRILVLDGGPFTLPEHAQDIPNLGVPAPRVVSDSGPAPDAQNPLPATRAELKQLGLDAKAVLENWGLAWNSSVRFGGLAYCLGGRSLYWGGWSPRYLDTEMHTAPVGMITDQTLWPAPVVDDLRARFFEEAAEQTGVTTSNDYINGDLHDFYRKRLFDLYASVPFHVPLTELPDYIKFAGPRMQAQLAQPPYPGFDQAIRLDAPLAVQIQTRPGFLPFNKFSSVPLAMAAARQAYGDSNGDNTRKRLMIVPNCHVKGLNSRSYTLATGATVQEVDRIDVSSAAGDDSFDLSGMVAGARRPVVVLALGAIESARLAVLAAGGTPNASLMGMNLMVHLRKNVSFTAPLPTIPSLADEELTALLVRCRTDINGTPAHFHLQISAAALATGAGAGQSDSLLFRSVPDLDNVRRFRETRPGEVDVSIRAVGEMLPDSRNAVTVPLQGPLREDDEHGVPRAQVVVQRGPFETQLMQRIDQAIDFVAANVFAAQTTAPNISPDGLGTTYHESGTLRMGEHPARSVVNSDGQFHNVTNLFAGDAAVLPTCGSANPTMNGVALRRRLARRLVPEGDGGKPPRSFAQYPMPAVAPAPGTILTLFDGQSLANWRMAGRGTFHAIDGALQSVPSFDLGLLWCTIPMPQNYRLELEFFTRTFQTNSGIFIRFKNPDGFTNPDGTAFSNPAWSAVYAGFEVQIDNTGAGQPIAGLPKHRTGAVYAVNYPGDPNADPTFPPATPDDFVNPQDCSVLAWNQYRIEVVNETIQTNLNGVSAAKFTIPDPNLHQFLPPYDPKRGRFTSAEPTFIGLQAYSNYSYTTAFRNIRVTVL